MFEKLTIFGMAHGLAAHAAARQSQIAQNVANADTPQYRARDVVPFAEVAKISPDQAGMRATRTQHGDFDNTSAQRFELRLTDDQASPNGNNVSIENEMLRGTAVRQQHDLALSIYSSSLNIIRTSLGRGR